MSNWYEPKSESVKEYNRNWAWACDQAEHDEKLGRPVKSYDEYMHMAAVYYKKLKEEG